MKAVFVHDTRFLVDEVGNVYCDSGLSNSSFARYLIHFDFLHVIARKASTTSMAAFASGLRPIDDERISFSFAPSISGLAQIFTGGRAAREIVRDRLKDSDAVIARLPSELGLLAAAVAQREQIPVAVEVVACAFSSLWYHGDPRGKLYAPIQAARVRRAVRGAKHVAYVSSHYLPQRYPATGQVCFASNVELDPTGGPNDPQVVPDDSKFIVGLIGNLATKYKGIDTAIKAIALCRREGFNVELRILGGGLARPWIEAAHRARVAEAVHFDGVRQPGAGVERWIDCLRLYIQPSLTEGLPRSLIEALNAGIPAFGSRVGGIPELLEADQMHDPGDYKTLAAMIARSIRDSAWLAALAQRGPIVAAQYDKRLLDDRRQRFWANFAAECRSRQETAQGFLRPTRGPIHVSAK